MLSRRDLLLAGVAAVGVAACGGNKGGRAATSATTGVTVGGPVTSVTAPPSGPAAFVAHGRRDRAEVAFTFHANIESDKARTDALLADAASANVPITVFAVGQWLDRDPSLAPRMLAAGHELANHTYTHPSLGALGGPAVATEIARCRDVLARQAPGLSHWFRPSGLDRPSALILAEAGRAGYATVVGYDVDPHDYQDPGATAIVDRVRTGLAPGSVVSLHFGHAGTVTAFPQLVDIANQRGLKVVTVSQLLRA
ncbi:MAG: Twin-arginine translocation pathway signal [Acidimicrobiales bacterium]|nr:Twin-arginine translocation pathway signal [Acidimicrobiales bacterium]